VPPRSAALRHYRGVSPSPSRVDTDSLRFEPLDRRWLDDVAALAADPHVRRFTRIPEPPPERFAEEWIDRYVSGRGPRAPRAGFAALDARGVFLGLALAPHIDYDEGEIELGYMVARAARGRGAATAMLMLLTEWAFDELGLQRAYLIIDVENDVSARVAERCGYTLEGVKRSILLKPGQRTDAGLWSRLPGDPSPGGTATATLG
jgi:RimJ/RimL family protein N-acetyltransferase